MTNIRITLKQRYLNVDMINVFDYWRYSTSLDVAGLNLMLDQFVSNHLAAMNSVQLNLVSNISLHAYRLDAANVAVTRLLTGNGNNVPANTSVIEPSWFAVGVRLNVGESFDTETTQPPTNGYNIRRGYKFVGGISEAQVTDGRFDPTYLPLAWADLLSAFAEDITINPGTVQIWNAVVLSSKPGEVVFPGLGTSGIVAPIQSAVVRDVTSLRSRKR